MCFELRLIILNTQALANTFLTHHPNSKYSLDIIIRELLFVLKSGVSWRNVRSPINYKTLFWHFNNFSKHHVFSRLFQKIKLLYLKKHLPSTFLIDSTPIGNKFGVNKIGRNKFYKNKFITKVSLLTDVTGFPLSIFFMKGNRHDNITFKKHVDDLLLVIPRRKLKIMADKGYASVDNYNYLNSNNIDHIIPPRKNMKIAKVYTYDKKEYVKRIKIEHIFGRLKLFKRVDLRYDKKLSNFSSFVYFGFSIIAINIFNKS